MATLATRTTKVAPSTMAMTLTPCLRNQVPRVLRFQVPEPSPNSESPIETLAAVASAYTRNAEPVDEAAPAHVNLRATLRTEAFEPSEQPVDHGARQAHEDNGGGKQQEDDS